MNRIRNLVARSLLVFVLLWTWLPQAHAQVTADEILSKMDDVQNRIRHEWARIEMRLIRDDEEVRRRELTMHVSIDDQEHTSALIEFTKPADISGLKLLTVQTEDGDNQRIYLPALRRIQRIAGNARSDRFAGSDLSYEDLRVREQKDYTSTLIQTTDSVWIIESIPIDNSSPYGKIVAEIDKEMISIVRAEYYDKKSRLWKVLTATGFTPVEKDTWRASHVTMTDLLDNRRTELEYLERDLATPISPDVYSDRYLRRGVK